MSTQTAQYEWSALKALAKLQLTLEESELILTTGIEKLIEYTNSDYILADNARVWAQLEKRRHDASRSLQTNVVNENNSSKTKKNIAKDILRNKIRKIIKDAI